MAKGWELGGISRVALNIVSPIRTMLVEAFNHKVIVSRIFKVNKTLIRSVYNFLPHICIHEVVQVILLSYLHNCSFLLELVTRKVFIVLISPLPDGILN